MLACLMAACAHAGAERHVDQDYGVVCYTYKRAISCVEIPEEEDEDDMHEEAVNRETAGLTPTTGTRWWYLPECLDKFEKKLLFEEIEERPWRVRGIMGCFISIGEDPNLWPAQDKKLVY